MQYFLVCVKRSHLHRRMSCRTLHAHGLIAYFFFCRTALRVAQSSKQDHTLLSGTRTFVWPFCRTKPVHRLCISPTILWRFAVRRLRLCSCPREKQSLVRLATQARTSSRHLFCRRPNLGMLASPLLTQERGKCSSIQDFYHSNRESSESRSSHVPADSERPVAMFSHKRKSCQVEIQLFCRSVIQRERILSEHREIRDFLELRADHAAQGEKASVLRLSDAEYLTRLLLEEQRNQILSEARSDMNMHEKRKSSSNNSFE